MRTLAQTAFLGGWPLEGMIPGLPTLIPTSDGMGGDMPLYVYVYAAMFMYMFLGF